MRRYLGKELSKDEGATLRRYEFKCAVCDEGFIAHDTREATVEVVCPKCGASDKSKIWRYVVSLDKEVSDAESI